MIYAVDDTGRRVPVVCVPSPDFRAAVMMFPGDRCLRFFTRGSDGIYREDDPSPKPWDQ